MPPKPPPPPPSEAELARQAEVRKRQEVLLRTRMEELQSEEERMSKWSEREIQMRWLDWLRSQKYKELSSEIEVIAQAHDKSVDRKNAVIEMLVHDIEESEEQFRLALRTHLNNMDSLIELQNRRMGDLHAEFETHLSDLRHEFELERAEITQKHEKNKQDIKVIIENMRREAEALDKQMQVNFATQKEETTEKSSDELHMLTTQLEFEIKDLQKEITTKNEEYQNKAGEKMKQFQDKSKKDRKQMDQITSMGKRIMKLQEQIASTKATCNNNMKECEERNQAMRQERDAIASHFKELKFKMQKWRRLQERRLAELVAMAHRTKNELKVRGDQAERILKLAELCQQAETERERFLTYNNDISVKEVATEVQMRLLDPSAPAPVKSFLEDLQDLSGAGGGPGGITDEDADMMTKFWLRYNKVLLDNAAIAQEQYHLKNENAKLKTLLKQYLDGISVNHDVMSANNNLLHVGTFHGTRVPGHAPPAQKPTGGGPITVVEARSVVREIAKQRAY
eukprot:PhF_6_TR22553/c1_g1_i1/m.32077